MNYEEEFNRLVKEAEGAVAKANKIAERGDLEKEALVEVESWESSDSWYDSGC